MGINPMIELGRLTFEAEPVKKNKVKDAKEYMDRMFFYLPSGTTVINRSERQRMEFEVLWVHDDPAQQGRMEIWTGSFLIGLVAAGIVWDGGPG